MALHHRTHPEFVPGCWACKAVSLHLSPGYSTGTASERRLDRDLEAYARMRRNGIQPARTTGAARVEATASEREQVEQPHVVRRIGLQAAKDMKRMESLL